MRKNKTEEKVRAFNAAEAKSFIAGLELAQPPLTLFDLRSETDKAGFVNQGSLTSFVAGMGRRNKKDVLNSTLLAQLAANRRHDRERDTENWYRWYRTVLENVGWVLQDFSFSRFSAGGTEFSVDEAIIDVLRAIATGDEMAVARETLQAVKNLSNNDGRLVLFEQSSHSLRSGNFQIMAASETDGVVAMRIGTFYFTSSEDVTKLLWFRFTDSSATIYKGVQTIVLDEDVYSEVRDDVVDRLGDNAERFVKDLDIGTP
ncbi:MAG: hypothetical protein AB7U82_25500 [Blastocatellales bacterium]